jgi:environmental stress-induced protein Ves
MLRLLRSSERKFTPWKNGAGKTREVISYPSNSSVQDFIWRVSMADVTAASAFSSFAGIKRTLAVISGCLKLSFSDGRVVTLEPSDAGFPFSGDLAVSGAPIGGPVLDLNVMAKDGCWVTSLERLSAGDHEIVGRRGRTTLVVATGLAAVETRRRRFDLAPLDALLIDGAGDVEDTVGACIGVMSGSPSYVIRISKQVGM